MNTRSFRSEWVIVAVLVGLALVMLAMAAAGANVTITPIGQQGHNPDSEPEHFYLFNITTRRYEDILQFEVDKSKGVIWVKTRAVNLTVVTYKFLDKDWASVLVNGTQTVVSSLNMTSVNSTKVKFDLGKWEFIDLGETLNIYREVKTKDEALNESWSFSFILGKVPKITFTVTDLDTKASESRSLEWRLKVSSSYYQLKTKVKANATETSFKVKDLSIDWVDFGRSGVQVEANNTTGEVVVTFHPDGKTGDYVIDPSVGMAMTPLATQSWVSLGFQNAQNPSNPSETTQFNWVDWIWYDMALPAVEHPVDSNPFPVPSGVTINVKFYDNWGRSWLSGYFGTGAPGTVTAVEGDLPVCWVSVQCWNGIRHNVFHTWLINETGVGTWSVIDEAKSFPLVVDDANPVDWIVWVPADLWINDAGYKLVLHGELIGRREFVLNFNVTLKTEPTTVWLRMYDSTTGVGIPWDTFLVYVDGILTPTDVVQTWTNVNMMVVVVDFFGNELYNSTAAPGEAPLFLWKIPLPVYSFKLFNQQPEYIHKVSVYYGLAGTPYEEYIAPLEVVELMLKAGIYRIDWVPYRNYVAQTTQRFDITVSEANYFLINGTTISRMVSDVAGVYALQQVITRFMTPDVLWTLETPPLVPTGQESDMECFWVHPYAVTRATTTQVISNSTSGTLEVPHPDKAGRTYYILSDLVYIAGDYLTHVVINWSENGTEFSNTTYNPGVLDLGPLGAEMTVWANRTITVRRVCEWREAELFYWLYTPSRREYTTTLWVNNTLDIVWRDVRWFVGFPESSDIDIDGVRIKDNNNGIWLVRGENFDVSVAGITMAFSQINITQKRSFTFWSWDSNASDSISPPLLTLVGEDRESHGGENMYHLEGTWTNSFATPYSGTVYLNIKTSGEISNVVVVINDRGLSDEQYTTAGKTVIIAAGGIGTVAVGDRITVDVYYDKDGTTDALSIFGPLLGPVSLYWMGLVAVLVGGWFGSFRIKGGERRQLYWISLVTLLCVFAIAGMLHYTGVIA